MDASGRRNRRRRAGGGHAAWPALLLMLVACSYRGEGIDDPVVRRLAWFSYISGDDIRAACGRAYLDRYRLVYNARYSEQVRTYEVVADGAGGAFLVARVLGPPNLIRFVIEDSMRPWRPDRAEARLTAAEFGRFKEVLAESGYFEPPPVGLRLFSEGYWWTASGCSDGRFRFNAWRVPPNRSAELAFAAFLFAYDATGIPVTPPRPMAVAEARFGPRGNRDDWGRRIGFTLEVGRLGVGGGLRGPFE